jgi:hypothetical protein
MANVNEMRASRGKESIFPSVERKPEIRKYKKEKKFDFWRNVGSKWGSVW